MPSLRDFLSLRGLQVGGVGASDSHPRITHVIASRLSGSCGLCTSDLHPRLSYAIASRLFLAARFDGLINLS